MKRLFHILSYTLGALMYYRWWRFFTWGSILASIILIVTMGIKGVLISSFISDVWIFTTLIVLVHEMVQTFKPSEEESRARFERAVERGDW